MSSVDLTRIAEKIDTLNALNALQHINRNLAVYNTPQAPGYCLNQTGKDCSRLNISYAFDVRCNSLKSVACSVSDVKNLMSTMEEELKKIQDILGKINNNIKEASSNTIDANQRVTINDMILDFVEEINVAVTNTQWNGMNLLSGTDSFSSIWILSDPNGNRPWKIFSNTSLDPSSLGLHNLDVTGVSGDQKNITDALSAIHYAINRTESAISGVCEFNARLIFIEGVITLTSANTESTFYRINNANMAEELIEASKLMILQQTSLAVNAQANMVPQFLLSLFS